jgi:chemotaxis protein MotB
MAFFVMLFALSEIRSDKYRQVAAEISRAFTRSPRVGGATGLRTATSFARHRRSALEASVTGPDLRVVKYDEGTRIVIGGKVLFERGSADLLPQAYQRLDETAQLLQGYKNRIEVRGHTSRGEVPQGSPYADDWELSFFRAKAVADYLINKCEIPEARLRVTGSSWHQPAASDLFSDEESGNRRVEVIEVGELTP